MSPSDFATLEGNLTASKCLNVNFIGFANIKFKFRESI